MTPMKDEIIKTLLEFFFEQFGEDAVGVGDWLAQSGQDVDQFYAEARKLQHELKLRD